MPPAHPSVPSGGPYISVPMSLTDPPLLRCPFGCQWYEKYGHLINHIERQHGGLFGAPSFSMAGWPHIFDPALHSTNFSPGNLSSFQHFQTEDPNVNGSLAAVAPSTSNHVGFAPNDSSALQGGGYGAVAPQSAPHPSYGSPPPQATTYSVTPTPYTMNENMNGPPIDPAVSQDALATNSVDAASAGNSSSSQRLGRDILSMTLSTHGPTTTIMQQILTVPLREMGTSQQLFD
ncbi:hypothetical protein F4806DRAFT_495562 [Annulohypoxylon nitens]|nr:hypothetical protein F4806DRAFT_495562 [Annulohypoxylon nitens]